MAELHGAAGSPHILGKGTAGKNDVGRICFCQKQCENGNYIPHQGPGAQVFVGINVNTINTIFNQL